MNPRRLPKPLRVLLIVLGTLSLALGVIGIFVPLLPTTPFLLLSVYCYSRGSDRLHRWLVTHPRLGPPIRDWREHGVVHPRAKALCALLMLSSAAYIWFVRQASPMALKWGILALSAGVLGFVLSRPSRSSRS